MGQEEDDMNTELKGCPFCGKVPEIKTIAGSYGYYSAKLGISCCNGISIGEDTEEYDWDKRVHINTTKKALTNIIARWNNRYSIGD